MLSRVIGREINRVKIILIAANVLVPLAIIVYAGVIYPQTDGYQKSRSRYRRAHPIAATIGGENNAITWFSSVQLVLVGAICFANYRLSRKVRALDPDQSRSWIWLVFCLGFLFLAVDEQFSYHEALRNDVFVPRDLFDFKYINAGDVGFALMSAIGLALVFFVYRELKASRSAFWLFWSGVGIALVVNLLDTINRDMLKEIGLPRHVKSPIEEILELWAQCLFLLSFLGILQVKFGRVAALTGNRETRTREDP